MLPALLATLAALPGCPGAVEPRVVAEGLGSLEAAIVDRRGRLFVSATAHAGVMMFDAPGEPGRLIADGITSPGGLAVLPDGDIVVGQGDALAQGVVGNVFGMAALIRIDPDTGEKETIATGLQMANGLARGADGAFYASNDAGTSIDRVEAGEVQQHWADVPSPNGLAIDTKQRYLYAAQTFQPAAVKRIDMRDPSQVTDHFVAPPESIAAGPDGMTIDEADRLFLATNAAGEVWRIDPDGSSCTIATGIDRASAVALGQGTRGFRHEHLYSVGFDGVIRELAGVRPPPAPVTLIVHPRRVRAGKRVRFRVTAVREDGSPVAREPVRFAGRTKRTSRSGLARFRVRLKRGRHPVELGDARVVVRAR